MKSKLSKITSRTLNILFMIALTVVSISCTKTETTDSTKFVLYYTGLTDIGPSMSGTIASPTYKGNPPYDFAITNVTLNGEKTNADIFTIDALSGALTLSSAKDTPIGIYKISISCYSNDERYEYIDATEVNMMKPVPDEITVTPNLLETDYENIRSNDETPELPTAQVTTDGNHISIKNYTIASVVYNNTVVSNPDNYFKISDKGEFSIVKGNAAIQPGIYTISLKLVTAAVNQDEEEGIFENALQVNVTSKPLALNYSPNEGMIEEENEISGQTTYQSSAPVFIGSTEELSYSIGKTEPETDKIQIDPETGVLSVAEGHLFKADEQYKISVKVANKFAPEGVIFENSFTLNVIKYINPIAHFSYPATEAIQGVEFSTNKSDEFIGDEVWYEFANLPEELEGDLVISKREGTVSAAQGNSIKPGTYVIQIKAHNTKNEETTTLNLTVVENKNYFTYIQYGNNLGLTPAADYANQFRVKTADDFVTLDLTPETDLKPGVEVKWSVKILYQASGTSIDESTGVITANGFKARNCGIILVTATAGTGLSAVTVETPVFFHYAEAINGVSVEYSPFVLQANPRKQSRSVVPVLDGLDDASQFVMDYRRTFTYYNINGRRADGTEHESGRSSDSPFLQKLWNDCESGNYSAKLPVSYYQDNNGTPKDDLTNSTLAYVDNEVSSENHLSVVVNANKWNDNGWANGCFIAQMTFLNNGNAAKINSGSQIFPLVIWFDTQF